MKRRHLLLLLAALPAACTSPNPTLYTLAPLPGTPRPSNVHTLELREIGLAQYLQRPQIVRSSEGYRLDVLSNQWWGEPLGAMLGRIIGQELTERLPGTTVFAENGAITADAGVTVAINVQRLDSDAAGNVVLIAQFEAAGKTTVTRGLTFHVTPTTADTAGLIAAMSSAVAQLADAVADSLPAPR
jgi:uncharacterized lipoprotein YmbA